LAKLFIRLLQGGVVSLSAIPILRETYPPILLRRKMLRLQKAGPPGIKYATPFSDSTVSRSTLFKRAIVRPMKMLFFSPIVLLLSIYIAIIYAFLYLIFSTITIVFEEKYHFSPGVVGLSFIGIGVGMFSGLLAFGAVSDNQVNKRAAAAAAAAAASGERGGVGTAGELKPEYRLYPMIHAAFAIPIGLFWYGWSVDKDDYWIMPMIGTAVFGLGLVGIYVRYKTPIPTLSSLQSQISRARLTARLFCPCRCQQQPISSTLTPPMPPVPWPRTWSYARSWVRSYPSQVCRYIRHWA
jgi:hypothetical protein